MKRKIMCLAVAVGLASGMAYATDPELKTTEPANDAGPVAEENSLSGMVESLNATAPLMMANGFRFDRASEEDSLLRLDYTMTDRTVEPGQLEDFTRMVKPTLTRVLCTSIVTESLALNNIPLKTVFRDKTGEVVSDITTELKGCHRTTVKAEEEIELTPAEMIGVSYSSRLPLDISDIVRLDAVDIQDGQLIYHHTILGDEGLALHENPSVGAFVRVAAANEMCNAFQQTYQGGNVGLSVKHEIINEAGTNVGAFLMTSADCI